MNKEENKDIIIGKNITFSYKDKTILDNQSFSFKKGEHIGIIGPPDKSGIRQIIQ